MCYSTDGYQSGARASSRLHAAVTRSTPSTKLLTSSEESTSRACPSGAQSGALTSLPQPGVSWKRTARTCRREMHMPRQSLVPASMFTVAGNCSQQSSQAVSTPFMAESPGCKPSIHSRYHKAVRRNSNAAGFPGFIQLPDAYKILFHNIASQTVPTFSRAIMALPRPSNEDRSECTLVSPFTSKHFYRGGGSGGYHHYGSVSNRLF